MQIGQYTVVAELGGGGMSSISVARSPTGALVVLKKQRDPAQDEVLRDEARVGIVLDHPALVETLDLVEDQGRPLLVLAFVPGASLYDLRLLGPLPPSLTARVGRQVCDGLACIHAATDENGRELNILHRDVTARNIILGYDGNARLIDLGIARSAVNQADRTQAGILKGTLRYMAPELFLTGTYTVATELWSLGVTLWEGLMGRPAVQVASPPALIAAISAGRIMNLQAGEQVDTRLKEAIAGLLATDPAERYENATEASKVFREIELGYSYFDQVARRVVINAVGEPPTFPSIAEAIEVGRTPRAMASYTGVDNDSSDSAPKEAPKEAQKPATTAAPDQTQQLNLRRRGKSRVAKLPPATRARSAPAPVSIPDAPPILRESETKLGNSTSNANNVSSQPAEDADWEDPTEQVAGQLDTATDHSEAKRLAGFNKEADSATAPGPAPVVGTVAVQNAPTNQTVLDGEIASFEQEDTDGEQPALTRADMDASDMTQAEMEPDSDSDANVTTVIDGSIGGAE